MARTWRWGAGSGPAWYMSRFPDGTKAGRGLNVGIVGEVPGMSMGVVAGTRRGNAGKEGRADCEVGGWRSPHGRPGVARRSCGLAETVYGGGAERTELISAQLTVLQTKNHFSTPKTTALVVGKIRSVARIAPRGNHMSFSSQEALTHTLCKVSHNCSWFWRQGKMQVPAISRLRLPDTFGRH